MIKYCLDCWNKNQQSLREQLEKDASLNSCEYEYLVKLVTRYILGKEWDAENIIVVDNGDYQGTLLFLIPHLCRLWILLWVRYASGDSGMW